MLVAFVIVNVGATFATDKPTVSGKAEIAP